MKKNNRAQYKKIDQELRHMIIDKIVHENIPIKDVANETNINVSTCKAILKVYQEEGRVGKKQNRNKIVEVVETFSFFMM